MADMEADAAFAQASHPGAQQRRCLHVRGKYPAGTSDESFDAERPRPFAQGVIVELMQPARHHACTRTVSTMEAVRRFGMSEVQAALARDQELAANRALGFEQVHGLAGIERSLCGHQPCGSAADDDNAGAIGKISFQGWVQPSRQVRRRAHFLLRKDPWSACAAAFRPASSSWRYRAGVFRTGSWAWPWEFLTMASILPHPRGKHGKSGQLRGGGRPPPAGGTYLPFLAALSARFSLRDLVGFFFASFFCSMPLAMVFSPWNRWWMPLADVTATRVPCATTEASLPCLIARSSPHWAMCSHPTASACCWCIAMPAPRTSTWASTTAWVARSRPMKTCWPGCVAKSWKRPASTAKPCRCAAPSAGRASARTARTGCVSSS